VGFIICPCRKARRAPHNEHLAGGICSEISVSRIPQAALIIPKAVKGLMMLNSRVLRVHWNFISSSVER
jgi:hypothetical protein